MCRQAAGEIFLINSRISGSLRIWQAGETGCGVD
jgi:hypothetical protein